MIRILAPEVQNQIAAGEVIERPASVVKELFENALDAGAQRIVVEIEQGGTTLVRVTDDGVGCGQEDLPLAFVAHATSKLSTLSDLDRIGSLGFRGEALAAIGSVAKCKMQSRVRGAREGWEIECSGGAVSQVRPSARPEGTSVEVRDIFFNTPARRRFLKATYAERARIQDLVARLATPRLDVDVTLIADGKTVLRLPVNSTLEERIGSAFGASLVSGMKRVEAALGDYSVTGVIVEPDRARSDATLELIWINGRFAKDRSTTMAVRQAFRQHLMHGRYPVYFLMLSLPPEEVDVNVHPQKSEVRFANQRKVAGLLHGAVLRTLGSGSGIQADPPSPGTEADRGGIEVQTELPRARSSTPADWPLFRPGSKANSQPGLVGERVAEAKESVQVPDRPKNPFAEITPREVLQVLDLYLVLEGRGGLVVVDQHALHERVLYEQLKRRHEGRLVQIQRLLAPEVLEVQPIDKAWLLEVKEDLAQEGLLLEDFGGHTIAVFGVPALLGKTGGKRLVETLLRAEGLEDARPRARAALAERFHSMACRAAVMSGDRLTTGEITALLESAKDLEHPHHCPHGRPTVLTFGRPELERYFKRRV